jgi:hypothetical protein
VNVYTVRKMMSLTKKRPRGGGGGGGGARGEDAGKLVQVLQGRQGLYVCVSVTHTHTHTYHPEHWRERESTEEGNRELETLSAGERETASKHHDSESVTTENHRD